MFLSNWHHSLTILGVFVQSAWLSGIGAPGEEWEKGKKKAEALMVSLFYGPMGLLP